MFTNDGVNGRRWLSAAVLLLSFMLLVMVASPDAVQSQEGRLDFTVRPFADGTFYSGIDLADMDYDGDPEILIGNRNMDAVEIWEYDPNLDTLVKIDTVIGFTHDIHEVKAADFDKDGDMDLVVGLRFHGLRYATNTGTPGTVGNWNLLHMDDKYSRQVLVEDFNQDGFLDIFHVLDICASGDILTYYGDGNGGFVPGTSIPDISTGAGFDAVDLDGDGWLDLIGTVGNFMRAFLNPGNNSDSWESVGPPTSACSSPDDCALESNISPSSGDLDGNGFLDQVAFRGHPTNTEIQAEVLIFEGSASNNELHWEIRVLEMIEPRFGYSVGVADLDEDGYLDVHFEGGHYFYGMLVYFGDGQGGFTPEIIALDHGLGGKNSLVMGDINSDGLQDIVTARYTDGGGSYSGFEVLFGKSTVDCTPPLDVDDQTTLNEAIFCANAADSGTPVINLVGDVYLTGPTTPISNPQADSIEIEGNNYAISGNSLDPILTMYSDTDVTLRNITISYGAPGIRHIERCDHFRPLIIENSYFTNNKYMAIDATYGCGNIGFGNLSVANSVISENQGTGIATIFSALTVDETMVHSNAGVGIRMTDSISTITNSTISFNEKTGIEAHITDLNLNNVTISNNAGDYCLELGSSYVTLRNVTMSDGRSAGIFAFDCSEVTLANTIIYNIFSGPACEIEPSGGGAQYIDGGFNIIEDDTCAGIEPGGDPLLGPLQDNGGPTWTRALSLGSPAINAITDPASCMLNRDQRGVSRPQGDYCDVGAFEYRSDPQLDLDNSAVSVDEGTIALNGGDVSDSDGDLDYLEASFGEVTHDNGSWSWIYDAADGPIEDDTVVITAYDRAGGSGQVSFQLTVNNVDPAIVGLTVPTIPVDINDQTLARIEVAFTDPAGVKDEYYTCLFDLNYDGETFDPDVTETGVTGTQCETEIAYTEPGVYTVMVQVNDKDNGSDTETAEDFIVIYDPFGSFVTGGGWINSEAGWCQLDDICSEVGGRANFGFVSKYKKGASVPTGNTEFNFKAGGLDFHSVSYDWLVVNQGGSYAQFKGNGTINGQGDYKFMLWAGDDEPDTFRIRIWYEDSGEIVVYDNGFDQVIGSGNIVVHTQ